MHAEETISRGRRETDEIDEVKLKFLERRENGFLLVATEYS